MFKHKGKNVVIDATAKIIGEGEVWIGDNVRIDAYSVITAGPSVVYIGSFTHIASHCYLSGAQGGITLGYGSGIAPHSSLYSAVEDYWSGRLTNPMIPRKFRSTDVGRIVIEPHVAIGSTSVVLQGKHLGYGSAIGALSLVNRSTDDLEIVQGTPIKRVAQRRERRFKEECKAFLDSMGAEQLERLHQECSLFGIREVI